MNSKPRERLALSIADGVPGTSMPAWRRVLGEPRIDEVLKYVETTFVKDPRRPVKAKHVPDRNPVPAGVESNTRGEQLFLKRCVGCHGRKADGKGPNSTDIVPRPRNLLNQAFVASVSDTRLLDSVLYGVQGTAMPPWIDYGLTDKDAGDVVNYIRSLNTGR